MTKLDKYISEAKRIEEDSLYSEKSHFYAGQYWGSMNIWLGGFSAFLAAIAGTSALSNFDHHNIIAGILALVVSALTAVLTFVDPSGRSSDHLKAGNNYNALRNDSRIFYEIELCKLDETEAVILIKKLSQRRNSLNADSPQVPKWAFKKARKGIEEGEAIYAVDK